MHVEESGSGDPPIVFVHGFACASSDWQGVAALLTPRQRVITCDLPAHGRSAGGLADCSIEAFARAVAGMLADLDLPPVILVGHSMGCRVVLECTHEAPERIAGVVLVDGSCVRSDDPTATGPGVVEQIQTVGYEGFTRRFFEATFVETSDPELKASITERALQLPADFGTALFTSIAAWDTSSMDAALAAVRVPLLAIQSTTLSPESVRVSLAPGESSPWLDLVRQLVPTARVEVVTGVGHFAQIEAADRVGALIADFASSTATEPQG